MLVNKIKIQEENYKMQTKNKEDEKKRTTR